MNIKTVKEVIIMDEIGVEREVDLDTKKLVGYDNEKGIIVYSAKDAGDGFEHWTDFIVRGTVDDIDEKLSQASSVRFEYAEAVDFNSAKNDPDKEIWNSIVAKVKDNPSKYFDKFGNWKD